jgi:hypothetical protein
MAKKKTAKLSDREKEAAKMGLSLKDYLKTDEYKKFKKSKDSKESSDKGYKDIIDSILKATPAQQEVLPDFETTYTPDLEAEDLTQSEALYTPYFEQQIANELEDLNAWSEAENVSYDRSLRRARISLAAQGGAIGEGATGERQTQEGEMAQDRETTRNETIRGVERNIGTEKLTGAGYQSAGQTQEGSIVGKMKTSIQEGQLWYKNQRAQRYYGDAKTYYSQPSQYSLEGNEI